MNFYSFKILFTLLCVWILTIGCSPQDGYESKPLIFNGYAQQCSDAFLKLDKAATAFQFGRISIDSLQKVDREARLAYKKIEFYIAYRFPEFANKNFNGAPLLQLEKSGTSSNILPPNGLQIIDELVFSENAEEEKTKIASLAKTLNAQFNILISGIEPLKLDRNDLVLAARMQLVRIFTLGITGFDTPGSVQGLKEAEVSLTAMANIFKIGSVSFKDQVSVKNVDALFMGAISFLQRGISFDDFDRLTFFREYLDPLYGELKKFQKKSDYSQISHRTAWNPNSISIFSTDFLNPYFFTELKKEEDSKELKKLGKTLFYDITLSGANKISCATCHQPDKAFTDNEVKSLSNNEDVTVLRNAPTLLNAVYADRFFYDVRAFSLEQQVAHVIFNPIEFNTDYAEIIEKLKNNKTYTEKFSALFDKKGINRTLFSQALASYVMSLRSFNSEFDQFARNETDVLKISVKNGFNLFMGKAACATCHFAPTFSGLVPPLFADSETEILGVLKDPNSQIKELDEDQGRSENGIAIEKTWIYERSFKTSTVRNSDLTAPYFHNGAYRTLEEVVDFYNEGGGEGMGLNVKNQTLPSAKLNLSETEKSDLVAFMKALTDTLVMVQ